ncbi:MAG: hypothetical protein IJX08_07860 [Clostridia bacterium]|nr:hypothetical protein [Clostridia bacterium]
MTTENINETTFEPSFEKASNAPKMVQIYLPLTRSETDDVYVAVNGKSFQIKRGVPVTVPDYVKEVLDHQNEMLFNALAYERGAQEKIDDKELN